jgi:tetratricopeptide (TPR) repeat protein
MSTTTKTQTQAQPLSNRTSNAADDINALDRVQVAYEKNKKVINGVLTAALIIGAAIFAYFKLYMGPREEKASAKVFYAQQYFQSDSLERALQGDGQHPGFIKVMRDYSGTKTANLCHYYAGICYLRMGDFKKAIKQLEDFSGKGTLLSTAAAGALGNAYLESGNVKKAIDQFKDASSVKEDVVLTPMYLINLGAAYEMNKQPEEAKKAYERIRDEYPQSTQARDIDRYLARLGVLD